MSTQPYSVGTVGEDISTIVSILPFGTVETKPGLYPGYFKIPECKDDSKPVLMHISSCIHLVHMPDDRPPMQVLTPSWEVCRSIVDDYMDGQLNISEDAKPGITFAKSAKLTQADMITKHKNVLDILKVQQRNHFQLVVRTADDDWAHYHSHKVISDYQRFAARALGLHVKKEWAQNISPETMANTCPSCGTPVANGVAICGLCRCIVDPEKFKELKFA
jgi:hypothetical protein